MVNDIVLLQMVDIALTPNGTGKLMDLVKGNY